MPRRCEAIGRPADIVGFHGQTILHQPRRAGRDLADRRRRGCWRSATGLPVACDFRTRRRRRGRRGRAAGAGLPRRPGGAAAAAAGGAEHRRRRQRDLDRRGRRRCWPSTPGRATARSTTGPPATPASDCDRDGTLAAAGRVDRAVLARLLAHPYFAPAAAEVARPAGLRRGAGGQRPGRPFAGGRRGDAGRVHRRGGGARAASRGAAALAGLRRRAAQPQS